MAKPRSLHLKKERLEGVQQVSSLGGQCSAPLYGCPPLGVPVAGGSYGPCLSSLALTPSLSLGSWGPTWMAISVRRRFRLQLNFQKLKLLLK